ncbi:nitroreductase [Leptospira ryugenii]|uniref:Nitroreductase n=1 Tax=Leptospira ryugenii TaxID=1917863 RepID=A0A2P2E0B6_9LEPT|nr:nitroreductase [Leptospira ryugenii]GBF50327.1 nitroreductase [Leptospira ryugenii]
MSEEFIDIHNKAITVTDAMSTRHSIRQFLDKPVPKEVLDRIFSTALRAPSWKNSQPWKLHIVQGQKKIELAKEMSEHAMQSSPQPETAWPEGYPSDAKKRMFDLGMRVYGVAGIDRKDKEARDQFTLRNFQFFDAPVAVFLSTRFELSFFVGIDIGCLVQSVLLLAREEGLGSCAQAALGAFPQVVKKSLSLPEEEKVILGFSLGYPKPDSDLNRFHTPREGKDSLIQYYS